MQNAVFKVCEKSNSGGLSECRSKCTMEPNSGSLTECKSESPQASELCAGHSDNHELHIV
jgi:hypothetical protein